MYTLFNRDALRTLHLSNGSKRIEGRPGLVWPIEMLAVPAFPNLYQLTVTHLKLDVVEWLNNTLNSVTELIITGGHRNRGERTDPEYLHRIMWVEAPLTFLYSREGHLQPRFTGTILDLLPMSSYYNLENLAVAVGAWQWQVCLSS
jgi:hypothetical protein